MAYDLTPRVGDSAHRLLFKIAAATSDVDDPPNPDAPENQLLRRIAAATAAGAGAGGAAWGDITGTISAQTDLQTALDAKVPLTSFTGGGILATGGYTLTVPATGTAALLGTANVFTAAQTVTQGTANAGILASTGYSLTGSDTTSMIDLAGTWNTSGAPTAIKLNITNTASNAASKLLDLQVGAVSKFKVLSSGAVTLGGGQSVPLTIASSTANVTLTATGDGSLLWSHSLIAPANGYLRFGFTGGTDPIIQSVASKLTLSQIATFQLGTDAAGVANQLLVAANRITSDGPGADLQFAGGNGRGGAGGSLIFSTYTSEGTATIGTLTTRLTLDTAGLLTFADEVNMAFSATTGTKIGTAATQKIGFWGVSPVAQPGTGGSTVSFSAGAGTPVLDDSTFDAYTLGQIVAALRSTGILA